MGGTSVPPFFRVRIIRVRIKGRLNQVGGAGLGLQIAGGSL